MNCLFSFPSLHDADGDAVDQNLLPSHFLILELIFLQILQVFQDLDLTLVLHVLLEYNLVELFLNFGLRFPFELLQPRPQFLLQLTKGLLVQQVALFPILKRLRDDRGLGQLRVAGVHRQRELADNLSALGRLLLGEYRLRHGDLEEPENTVLHALADFLGDGLPVFFMFQHCLRQFLDLFLAPWVRLISLVIGREGKQRIHVSFGKVFSLQRLWLPFILVAVLAKYVLLAEPGQCVTQVLDRVV